MKTAAVIPAYNEGPRINEVLLELRSRVDDVIVVDDGSSDDTYTIAKQVPGIVVLKHAVNRGQGAALRTGTEAALARGSDIVVHFDADGQHDPKEIPAFCEALRQRELDVVFGSRFLGVDSMGMPATRRMLLKAARGFNAMALGIPRRVTDPQIGFRAMKAHAAGRIDFQQDRMAHCSEILRLVTRSDLRWAELPVRIRYTSDTLAKGQKPTDALKIVWQLIIGAFH